MDVIINNPPAQTFQTQAVPSYPAGYYAPHDHGGPGFLLPLLLIGGAVLFFRGRGRRHWRERRMMMGAGNGRRLGGADGRQQGRRRLEREAAAWTGPLLQRRRAEHCPRALCPRRDRRRAV
ncbi:hypothetical protein [Deinococcus sonorensis]|uniref:LPXTG cell wall anchor domain-containing protein n=1 Tax=Deinococcus sonorensis KR-87 TaxID=694439 RepID=A0AAU7U7G7_9DEIO